MTSLDVVTRDCFNALIQLRAAQGRSHTPPDQIYQNLVHFIDTMRQQAQRNGISQADCEDVQYAIVALADEIAMRMPGTIRDFWMSRPLQLHYFNENVAGEGFFVRLGRIMSAPDRSDVLQVYLTCLLFGFQGRYAMRGGELQLDALIRSVKERLGLLVKASPLSVHHLRPKERRSVANDAMPAVWLALFGLLFSIGLITVLRVSLDSRTESVLERIDRLVGG